MIFKGNLLPTNPTKTRESLYNALRYQESFNKQLEAFHKYDGEVLHTCTGPCGKL